MDSTTATISLREANAKLPTCSPGARQRSLCSHIPLLKKQLGKFLWTPTGLAPVLKEIFRNAFKDNIQITPPPKSGCLEAIYLKEVPAAFPQDVNEGSKHVDRESSAQGTSRMLPPSAGTPAERVRRETPESLPASESHGFPGRAEKRAPSPCLSPALSEMLERDPRPRRRLWIPAGLRLCDLSPMFTQPRAGSLRHQPRLAQPLRDQVSGSLAYK